MRLLYDLDDTLAHFRENFDLKRLTLYPHLTGIPVLRDYASFNLWQDRTDEEQAAISEIMNLPNFYRELVPYEGAIDAVNEAVSMGHEVFFLSAPWVTNPTGASDKYAWVEEHFGLDMAKKLILSRDKTIVAGDVLWDDKHPIPNKHLASWTQVFVDAPYNRDQPGYRIQDWTTDEWKNILAEIEEDKNEKAERKELLETLGTLPW